MSAIVDITRIQEASDGDVSFEIEIIQMYLEDAESLIETIANGLKNRDYSELRPIAHNLKGASANIGANAVYKVAGAIEHEVHTQAMNDPDARRTALVEAFAQTQSYYKTYIAERA